MMETDFSTYSGGQFLLFYGLLGVAAIIASIWVPAFLRDEGHDGVVTETSEWAYLAGGSRRLVEATIARLIGVEALKVTSDRKLTVARPDGGENVIEKTLLRKVGNFGLKSAHRTAADYAEQVDQRLVDKGLLLDRGARSTMRLLTAAPILVVLAIGGYRLWAGLNQGEPVGFLIGIMVFLTVIMLARMGKLNPRTRAGDAALASSKAVQSRLRSAPTSPELGTGVALFGTAVLVGTPYSELHAMRNAAGANGAGGYAGDGDGGSDGGSDGGGDSGCGGGCGGCGG